MNSTLITSYERDNETELDFAQARMYANKLGRFTTTDPILMNLKRVADPQRLNLYVYVRNNPLKYIDITGEDVLIALTGGPFGGGKSITAEQAGTTGKIVSAAEAEAKERNIELSSLIIAPGFTAGSSVQTAYDFIKANYTEGERLVIYGYSQGGDFAVEIAERLKADNIEVDLLITVDASDGPLQNTTVNRDIPSNVKLNRNIYQTSDSASSSSTESGKSSSESSESSESNSGTSNSPGSNGGPNRAVDSSKTQINNHNLTHPTITHQSIDEYTLEVNIQSVKNHLSP